VSEFPQLVSVVLDTTDARRLAEFYRQLLGLEYRPGDEAPPAGQPDTNGQDWLVLTGGMGRTRIAFQQVASLPNATWPEGPIPQQLHLDLRVASKAELDVQHERVLGLGAVLLRDLRDRAEEPICIYADPAGHPFCIFVG
jgi:catechol 2,3-dioxygenase-like lactoylglutathione lyase family enzyme